MDFGYAARKFNRAKWEKPPFIKDDDIPADAVTICLKTGDNKLSLWECTDEKTSLEDVVLALATGVRVGQLEKMHVIALPKEELASAQLVLYKSQGDTQVQELRERHLDLIELTLSKLAAFARLMATQMRGDINCHSFTKKEVAKIINNSISAGRITADKLAPGIQAELDRLRRSK